MSKGRHWVLVVRVSAEFCMRSSDELMSLLGSAPEQCRDQ